MKTLEKILNRLTHLNSGYDVSNRPTGSKLIVVVGMILIIALAVMGTVHLVNG